MKNYLDFLYSFFVSDNVTFPNLRQHCDVSIVNGPVVIPINKQFVLCAKDEITFIRQ